jgi:hypothetical protein
MAGKTSASAVAMNQSSRGLGYCVEVNPPDGRGMSLLRRSGVLFALFAVLAFAVGCGGSVIDQVKVQDLVKEEVENSQKEKVSSVECPSGVNVDPGATFACKVGLSDGKMLTAKLKIRDNDANLSLFYLGPNE